MTLKYKIIIPALFIFILTSCGEKKPDRKLLDHILDGKKAYLTKVNQFTIQEDSATYIGRFLGAKYRTGKLVISDFLQPVLFFIDKSTGRIVKKIHWKTGKGPGEVNKIGSFEILNDRIYISDIGNFRWSVFDTSGTFIKTANPFTDSLLAGSHKGLYIGNGNFTEIYANRIYNCIIEIERNRDLYQHKSKSIAILDSSLKIIKAFGFMDEIYSKLKLSSIFPLITIDRNGYIYFSQTPVYRIYKFDSNGKFIKTFGHKGKFRLVEEEIPDYLSIQEINKKSLNYSHSWNMFSSPAGYIIHQFIDLTDTFFKTRNLLDRIHYLKVYDTEGNYIPSDIKLPGMLLIVDEKGKLYIQEKDEPGKRVISVYQLNINDE